MVRYDISDDRWTEVAPMPIGVNHPGITAHGGRVYVLGGNLGSDEKSTRLYRYDPGRDRWKRLADAPTARAALALGGIGDRLYAAGGYTADDDTVQRLEIYNLERDRWSGGREDADRPQPRRRRGLQRRPGRHRRPAGPGPRRPDDGRALRPRARPLEHAPRPAHGAQRPRDGDRRRRRGGRIVVFGGEELDGGTTIEQVELFDPRDGGWAALPEMVTPRHGVGGAAKGDRVYALEGGPQPGLAYSRALEYLDLP